MPELDPRQFRFVVVSGTGTVGNQLVAGDRVISASMFVTPASTANGQIAVNPFALGAPTTVDVAPGESICLSPNLATLFSVAFTVNAGAVAKWVLQLWRPVG